MQTLRWLLDRVLRKECSSLGSRELRETCVLAHPAVLRQPFLLEWLGGPGLWCSVRVWNLVLDPPLSRSGASMSTAWGAEGSDDLSLHQKARARGTARGAPAAPGFDPGLQSTGRSRVQRRLGRCARTRVCPQTERLYSRVGFPINKCYQRMKEHICLLGTAPPAVLGTPHLHTGTGGWRACRLPSAQPRS